MAFVIEDGTGIDDANALVSVAELDEYLTDRNESTTQTNAEKQAAIITASQDFIDTFYTFNGAMLTTTQGMQIPTDETPLNADIKRAALMATSLDLKDRLFVDVSTFNSRNVIEEESKVGSLMDKVVYNEGDPGYSTTYPTDAIDKILNKYTGNSGSLGRLVIG